MPKEYPIIIEELAIDEKGYYYITCEGTKFRLVRCKKTHKGVK